MTALRRDGGERTLWFRIIILRRRMWLETALNYTKEERIALLRGSLTLLRVMRDSADGDLDMANVVMAVRLAELENRPINVASIAVSVGVSRGCVTRKLEKAGVEWVPIGRRAVPVVPPLLSARAIHSVATIYRNVVRALSTVSAAVVLHYGSDA